VLSVLEGAVLASPPTADAVRELVGADVHDALGQLRDPRPAVGTRRRPARRRRGARGAGQHPRGARAARVPAARLRPGPIRSENRRGPRATTRLRCSPTRPPPPPAAGRPRADDGRCCRGAGPAAPRSASSRTPGARSTLATADSPAAAGCSPAGLLVPSDTAQPSSCRAMVGPGAARSRAA
jgi:hypothetical protein